MRSPFFHCLPLIVRFTFPTSLVNDIKPELRSEHLAIVYVFVFFRFLFFSPTGPWLSSFLSNSEELSNYLSKDKKTCEAVAALTVEVGTHLDSSVVSARTNSNSSFFLVSRAPVLVLTQNGGLSRLGFAFMAALLEARWLCRS
jgi:hypothetical protein